MQLGKVDFTRQLYDYLNEFYDHGTIPVDSFFKGIRRIREDIVLDVNERKRDYKFKIEHVLQDYK